MRAQHMAYLAVYLTCVGLQAQASDPVVSNVWAVQLTGTGNLEIHYDLADADTTNLAVTVNVSTNGGASWFTPAASNLMGAVYPTPVVPGSDRIITWQGWHELPAQIYSAMKVKVAVGITNTSAEVAWFKMDDNASNRIVVDSSSSAYNATNITRNTSERTVAGVMGTALSFRTTETAVSLSPNALSAFDGSSWTVAYWGKRALNNAHSEWFWVKDIVYDGMGWYHNYQSGMGWLWYYNPGTWQSISCTFPAETWKHFAFVRIGNVLKLYVDGALAGTSVPSAGATKSTAMYFGGTYFQTNWDNTRSVDDLRVYGFALTDDNVASLFNSGEGLETPLFMAGSSFNVSPATVYDLSSSYMAVGIPVTSVGNSDALRTTSDNSGDGGTSITLGGVGLLADGETTGIEWTATGSGVLAFDWMVSSEEDYDWLRFYEVGGTTTNFISGTGVGWSRFFVTVDGDPGALHTFRWEYVKDVSEYVGLDCGWVDAVSWTPLYSLTVNGGTGSGTYTNQHGVVILANAPPAGYVFDRWTGATQYIANVTSTTTIATMPATDITLASTYRLTQLSVAGGVPITPVGITNAVRTTADNSGDGGTSVRLGTVGLLADGEMAGIEWTMTGSGVLAFDWIVSSEEGYDWLSFYEVGVGVTNRISGTGAGWTRVFIEVSGAPDATHTYRWEYVKDPLGDYVGEDCGCVDAVIWSPFYTLTVNGGTGSGAYTNGTTVVINSMAPAEHYKFDRWTGDTNYIADAFASSSTVVMPATGVVVIATYDTILYTLSVSHGSGGGAYSFSTPVEIGATLYEGKRFYRWTGDVESVADVASATTTVVTTEHSLSLVATYSVPLTVNSGTGGGWYPEGGTVAVIADPDPLYMEFAGWTGDDAELLADPVARVTSLTIPSRSAMLTATYRDSVARVAGCYGRAFSLFGTSGGLSTDEAAGSPSGTPAVKLGGAGVVPDNGFAAFETVVSGSGQISFWWRVSSESNADFLKFLADGSTVASISGTKGPWAQVSYRVEGAGVSHTLRWEYAKNGSLASSTDAGWVDDIVWTGDVPDPVIAPDVRAAAATNGTFTLSFIGERGIPYTVYSNATLSVWGWAPMDIEPQERGETNGLFNFEAIAVPPAGQPSSFYRVISGTHP